MIWNALSEFFVDVWNFIEGISYWLAAIIGLMSILFFVATKAVKYKNTVVVTILCYLMVKVVGGV